MHHWIAGSDGLISATWLHKHDWGSAGFCLLYFLGEGYFILTQKPNSSRKGQNKECERESNVLFIPLRAPSQTKAPTYSPMFFSVDYFLRRLGVFFIVPAISCHTQQFSSPNREVSLFFPFDFLTFVSWSKREGWIAWCLLRRSSLVSDAGAIQLVTQAREPDPAEVSEPQEGSELHRKLTPPLMLIALKALLCRRGRAQPTGKHPAQHHWDVWTTYTVTDRGRMCIYPQLPIQKQRMVGRGGRNEFSLFSPIGPLSFPWDISCLYWKNKACKHRPNETRII